MIGYEGDTVLPTLVVTDSEGRVVFADQTDNYRVRPTPDTVLAALGDCDSASGSYGAGTGEGERSGSYQAGGKTGGASPR